MIMMDKLPEGHKAPKDWEEYLLDAVVVGNKLNGPLISSIVIIIRTT